MPLPASSTAFRLWPLTVALVAAAHLRSRLDRRHRLALGGALAVAPIMPLLTAVLTSASTIAQLAAGRLDAMELWRVWLYAWPLRCLWTAGAGVVALSVLLSPPPEGDRTSGWILRGAAWIHCTWSFLFLVVLSNFPEA